MRYAISGNRNLLWILLWKLSPNFVVSSTLNTALVSCVWAVGRLVRWGEVTKGRAVLYEVGLTPWQAVAVQWWCGLSTAGSHRLDTQWTHCVLAANTTLLLLTATRDTWLHVATRGHTCQLWTHVVLRSCYCRDLWQGLGLGNELNNACIRNTFKSFKWAVIFNCLY